MMRRATMLSKASTICAALLCLCVAPMAGAAPTLQQDTTPPTITARDIEVQTNSAEGAFVVFDNNISASDDSGQAPSVICDPASGSYFVRGSTTVNCTASDEAGNEASASFQVFVANPALGDTDVSIRDIKLSAEPALAGQIVNYYVDIYNAGPSQLRDASVAISVPVELELLAIPENCTAASVTLNCTVESLVAKRIASFTIEGRVNRDTIGPLQLGATVSLPASLNDLLPENNQLSRVVGVQPAPAPGTEIYLPLIRR